MSRHSKSKQPNSTSNHNDGSLNLQSVLNIELTNATPNNNNNNNKLQFVTAFRVYALVVTSICILAVDFAVFPRRLAKTEIYGTGLMDLGVGVFTLANALVSSEARGACKTDK